MKNISDLKTFEGFANWNDGELKDFIEYFEEKKYKVNEMIVNENTEGQELYLIVKGKVRVEREVMGEAQTLKILEKGEIFGEMSLFDNYPRSASVRCFKEAKLLLLKKESYDKFEKDKPALATKFLKQIIQTLSMRLRQTNKNLEVLSMWLI